MIYAISPDGSDDISYHGATSRGSKSLYLRRKVGTDTKIPDDAITMDITVNNVSNNKININSKNRQLLRIGHSGVWCGVFYLENSIIVGSGFH